ARRVAARARALVMTAVAHDPYLAPDDAVWRGAERLVDVRDLWRQSDVLSLHLPLTPETHRLVNGEVLAALKPETLLINTARGGIVDENALIEALAQGRLGGAALDVFEAEPLSAAAAAPFEGLPNVILTPHIAGATKEANQRVSQLTVANVLAALEATHG
ncbi:MAG: NAD(P)-dependent oxidoreductase, partial [Candidatus Competibacterales bacterium]